MGCSHPLFLKYDTPCALLTQIFVFLSKNANSMSHFKRAKMSHCAKKTLKLGFPYNPATFITEINNRWLVFFDKLIDSFVHALKLLVVIVVPREEAA